MSTGDKDDPYPIEVGKANNIIQLPQVARVMRRTPRINSRDWDIPYLAGYSQDGEWIFIDRDLKMWVYLTKQILTNRFLILHEHVEKSVVSAILEARGKELQQILSLLSMLRPDDELYFHCHGVATAIEEYAVKLSYGDQGLRSYNKFMKTQVKRAEDERIRRVPSTLDMLPYQGADAQDARLRRVMEQHMEAA